MSAKMMKYLKKIFYSVATVALTAVITELASSGCYFIYYQPKAPERLGEYSRNR